MSHSNSPTNPPIGTSALLVVAFSIAVSIGVGRLVPAFKGIFDELDAKLPPATQFVFNTYPWVWIGVVLSGLVWFLAHRGILPQPWSRLLLRGITMCMSAYLALTVVAIYLPQFAVMDAIK